MLKFKLKLPTAFLNINVTKKTYDDCKLYLEVQNDAIRYTNTFIGVRAKIQNELPKGIEKLQIHLQQLKKLIKSKAKKSKFVTLDIEYTKGDEKALVTLENGESAEIDVFVNRVYKPIDDIIASSLYEHEWRKIDSNILELRSKEYESKNISIKTSRYYFTINVDDEAFYETEHNYEFQDSHFGVKFENFLALLNSDEEILFGIDDKPVYRWRQGIFDIVEMVNFI